MTITVRLFAAARARVGQSVVEVSLPAPASVKELRQALARQHPELALLLPHCVFAINASYANEDAAVAAESDVACIPPVSGG